MKLFQTAILIAACSAFPLLGADADLLKYVGSDAKEVAGIYVNRVVTSPLGQFLQSQVGQDRPQMTKFIDVTGFDFRRDLQEIVIAARGGQQRKPGLIIARGTFDVAQIDTAATGAKITKETYAGTDLYRSPSGQQWFAFPEPSIAVAGEESLVKAALDRRASQVALEPRLAQKIDAASALYDVWFAAVEPAAVGFGKANLPQTAVDVVSGGLKFGPNVELNAEAIMRTEKDAQSLAQIIQFVQGVAELQSSRNPQMAHIFGLLQKSQTTVNGSTVRFSTSASEEDIEKIIRRPQRAAAVRQ